MKWHWAAALFGLAAIALSVLSCFGGTESWAEALRWSLPVPILIGGALEASAVWRERRSHRSLDRELRVTRESYESLRARDEATAMLRHDMKKHLTMAGALLDKGDAERARTYLAEAGGVSGTIPELMDTGNRMIDLIFSSAMFRAKQQGVQVTVLRADAPPTLPLSDAELTSLLLNALDNAIRAARRSAGWIRLDLHRKEHMFYIGVTNACPDGDAPREPQEGHGYGILIMRRIVERHFGVMDARREGDTYTVSILLPERAPGGKL